MKPPVDHVRVSARCKEILIRIKRHTGLEHWNEICRVAFCRSLANSTPPSRSAASSDSTIDMEWKTFAGTYHMELAALVLFKAASDGIDTSKKENIAEYFRSHLERGITSMNTMKNINEMLNL